MHKTEHAVDRETGAVVAVTLQEADMGDTTRVKETLAEAGTTVADLASSPRHIARSERISRTTIENINPILRGWVKYFAIGHSSRCFSYVRYRVEKKIRRHLATACKRQGFGWKRWSREWLYGTLGLFSEYRVSYEQSVSAVAPA